MEESLPHAIALAHDGYGQLLGRRPPAGFAGLGTHLFACHDPPVIAFQSGSLEHFVAEILRSANPPHESEVDRVHGHVTMDIWKHNPGTVSVRTASSSEDDVLRTFAQSLDDSY